MKTQIYGHPYDLNPTIKTAVQKLKRSDIFSHYKKKPTIFYEEYADTSWVQVKLPWPKTNEDAAFNHSTCDMVQSFIAGFLAK